MIKSPHITGGHRVNSNIVLSFHEHSLKSPEALAVSAELKLLDGHAATDTQGSP